MIGVLCIQCIDAESGKTGDFLRDIESNKTLTPVFRSLCEFFPWLHSNGWEQMPYDLNYPTGRYQKV